MSNRYTIVIPTYNNRHRYLNRILDYFSQFKLNIIVVDSSRTKLPDYKRHKINYIHLPETNYTLKLYKAFEMVDTQYALLCADDDFIIPTAIDKCIDFLDENQDYSSVQGNIIAFKNKRFGAIKTFPWMFHTYNLDFNSDKATDRLSEFFNNHLYLHYSVHRVESLRNSFKFTKDYEDKIAGSTIEYILDIIGIIDGKHKVLSIFYYVSELVKVSARNIYSPVKHIRHSSEFISIINILGKYLESNSSLSTKESIMFIEKIFDESWFFTERIVKPVGSYPLENAGKLKIIVDKLGFLRPLKELYSNLYYRNMKKKKEKEYEKLVEQAKALQGYPYSEEDAMKEWNKIKKYIKKHGIINYNI